MATGAAPNATRLTDSDVIRRYYKENDYLQSPEGILKALSAIISIATSAIFMATGTCSGAPRLLNHMNIVMMICGAFLCFTYAIVLLDVPEYAPLPCLYTDIVTTAGTGVLMLVIAVLSLFFCTINDIVTSMYIPMVIFNAVLLISCVLVTYIKVMHQKDMAMAVTHMQPSCLQPADQDV